MSNSCKNLYSVGFPLISRNMEKGLGSGNRHHLNLVRKESPIIGKTTPFRSLTIARFTHWMDNSLIYTSIGPKSISDILLIWLDQSSIFP